MYVWENEMVHIADELGVEYVINKNNVLFYERIKIEGGESNGDNRGSHGSSGKIGKRKQEVK